MPEKLEEYSKDELISLVKALKSRKTYGLVWEDKEENVAQLCRTKLPVLVLDSKRSINADSHSPTHVIIEGDNYHALSALNFTHAGKVDLIYIDPPYNTGNKDFIYNDDYVDAEDTYKHSKWLSFMEKRLRLAHSLLTDQGSLFASIDDNEYPRLVMLMELIFGEKNVKTIVVKMSEATGVKMSSVLATGRVPKLKEYVVMEHERLVEAKRIFMDDKLRFDKYVSEQELEAASTKEKAEKAYDKRLKFAGEVRNLQDEIEKIESETRQVDEKIDEY